MNSRKRILGCFICILAFSISSKTVSAAEFIIKDGKPNAEIVVSKESPRMARLAALELQYYLEQMSGARLPMVFETTEIYPLKIYVGESEYTKQLGITDSSLKYGAFHIKTGANYLVLLGDDYDYSPIKPYATRYSSSKEEYNRVDAKWKKMISGKTDSAWQLPWRNSWKKWWNPSNFEEIMANRYGEENKTIWNPKALKWTRDYFNEGEGTGY